jgi:hypothetical protein
MNRHERRRAARKMRHNSFVANYVSHLPEIPLNAPFEPGRVYHCAYFHDECCAIYDKDHGSLADCNCTPIVRRYIEPRRS